MLRPGGQASVADKEQIRLAALKIAKYMWWEHSKKGFEYWNAVYEELMRIAMTGEP